MNPESIQVKPIQILIVDDTPNNIRLLSEILTDEGYEVRKALNGQMALASVQANRPDLILLDIQMPGMNGYQVCQALKASDLTLDIPVIFISALDQVEDKPQAFDAGGG
jgi:CheY-like chemotaxis protein